MINYTHTYMRVYVLFILFTFFTHVTVVRSDKVHRLNITIDTIEIYI